MQRRNVVLIISAIIVVVCIIFFVGLAQYNGKQVVSNITCVPITQCPSYYKLLLRKPVSEESLVLIRAASCGFEGMIEKVWCVEVRNVTDEDLEESYYYNRSINEDVDLEKVPSVDRKLFREQYKKCGPTMESRIIGGNSTSLDEYPWTVVLDYQLDKEPPFPACGGTLISDRYVLTAAHCITRAGPPVRVRLGDYNLTSDTSEEDCVVLNLEFGDKECAPPPVLVEIEKIDVHANWLRQDPGFYDDIALIRLARPVRLGDFVNVICLPEETYATKQNQTFTAAGWGVTENGTNSDVKLQVDLPLFPIERCTKRLRRDIKDGQICAGGIKGEDTCKGDSGGPLMAFDFTLAKWKLAGIVSMGAKQCGRQNVPAVYTFVVTYLDWIFDKIKP